jgi:hypothetical protein
LLTQGVLRMGRRGFQKTLFSEMLLSCGLLRLSVHVGRKLEEVFNLTWSAMPSTFSKCLYPEQRALLLRGPGGRKTRIAAAFGGPASLLVTWKRS